VSISYERLRELVEDAMAVDSAGGQMQPSGPAGVPHRMPGSETADKVQHRGDPEANKMFNVALAAREATEKLVEALDDPIFDNAYEYAFKASALLRKTINSLIETGAQPMPDQEVVAPPSNQQRWGGYVPYSGALEYRANGVAAGMMDEAMVGDASEEVKAVIQGYEELEPEEQQLFHAYVSGATTDGRE
jgi:hypothetical protein